MIKEDEQEATEDKLVMNIQDIENLLPVADDAALQATVDRLAKKTPSAQHQRSTTPASDLQNSMHVKELARTFVRDVKDGSSYQMGFTEYDWTATRNLLSNKEKMDSPVAGDHKMKIEKLQRLVTDTFQGSLQAYKEMKDVHGKKKIVDAIGAIQRSQRADFLKDLMQEGDSRWPLRKAYPTQVLNVPLEVPRLLPTVQRAKKGKIELMKVPDFKRISFQSINRSHYQSAKMTPKSSPQKESAAPTSRDLVTQRNSGPEPCTQARKPRTALEVYCSRTSKLQNQARRQRSLDMPAPPELRQALEATPPLKTAYAARRSSLQKSRHELSQ